MKINKKIIFTLFALTLVSCIAKKENEIVNFQDKNLNSKEPKISTKESYKKNDSEVKKNNTFYFEFDKYNLKKDQINTLKEHVNFIKKNNIDHVTIEGHTDEIGTSEYNIALGERRAKSIKMYLERKGINTEIISIISYGKEKPLFSGNNEFAHSKNRRAIIKY